jgi:two-component system, chemotaxis family, sensor kinase CheA
MQEILDTLMNGVIAGPDDLMGIGECLNLLDSLENSGSLQGRCTQDLGELRRIFNRIILEESSDPDDDWLRVRTLIEGLGSGNSADQPAVEPLSSMNGDWEVIQGLVEEVCGEGPSEGPVQAYFEQPDEEEKEEGPSSLVEGGEPAEIQDPELLNDFLEEAKEHLASIELNILALETSPGDTEAINAIFRPFHSIKGVAGFLNLKDVHFLSHEVENILDEARSNRLQVTDDVIDLVLKSGDILKAMMAEMERALAHNTPIPSFAGHVKQFSEQLKLFHSRGTAGPDTTVKKVGEILVEREVVTTTVVEEAAVSSKTKGVKLGEHLVSEGVVSAQDVSMALREQRHAKENAASVRVDTRKLDNLVDMVGELVIAQSMVLQSPEVQGIKDQKFQKDTVQLRRITNELQRISMSMRMVPIKSTFQKMIRLVRDVSKKSGKEAMLEMRGEETEIDRNMVEEIYEPLVHMIRNSIDHGIETPDERVRAGKNPTGTVLLAAEQKGGHIVIDIDDDGRGLDRERILVKAIERGVVSADDVPDDKSIFELIFHPGFSTKETITSVSGRGVGMDVVKKSVERLKGKIEIASVAGQGSHFQFKLPLTMAITDGMIIQVGKERYVVPTIALKESFRPSQDSYMTVQGKTEMIKVRGSIMPLIRLHQIFGIEPRYHNPWEGLLLVVNEDNRSCCLMADEIVGRQEVVIKSLGSSLREVSGISGGAILGDGRVALIIDVRGIVSYYEENHK